MTPEEKYMLFERYSSNELSEKEKEAFITLLNDNSTVKEEFTLYKELNVHLKAKLHSEDKEDELVQSLKGIGDVYFNKNSPKKKSKVIQMPSWVYGVAASVAILIGVYTFTQKNPTYDDFAAIPTLSITERGNAQELIKEAENAFNKKSYKNAEKHLFQLLSADEDNAKYQFFYGITLLELDSHEEASLVFEKLQNGTSVYKYRALWFEALNQLKQKKYKVCAELLKKIPSDSEDFQQAQKLLKKVINK